MDDRGARPFASVPEPKLTREKMEELTTKECLLKEARKKVNASLEWQKTIADFLESLEVAPDTTAFKEYLDSLDPEEWTGSTHYKTSDDAPEPIELIFALGHGEGFCLGSIIKYASRYARSEKPESDLRKLRHYTEMIAAWKDGGFEGLRGVLGKEEPK